MCIFGINAVTLHPNKRIFGILQNLFRYASVKHVN